MSTELHDRIVALGTQPISAESRVGDPIRYDETFESLQAQMDRMGSLTGEVVEWSTVVDLSTEILKSKSKDLLVFTYLTVGLFESQGYAGLAAAFAGYCGFLENFWHECFPKVKPPHGRYNAIQYLTDKLLPSVELKGGKAARHPTDAEKEAVHECAAAVAKLDETVAKVFEGQPETPNLLPLVRALKALKEKVGPLVSEQPAAAAAPADGTAAPQAAPAAAPAAGGGVPDTFASATQAAQTIVKVARFLLGQDSKDARAYRLSRAVHFGGLAAAPKAGLIPAPPPQRRQAFETQATAGAWPQLLSEAEAQFQVTPLWLDLQRYVALAADGQGPAFAPVRDAVVMEMVGLQQRLPELFDVTFKDGTPFASGATRAWLDEAGKQFGGGGGGGSGPSGDAIAEAIQEARKLLAESKGADAVARLGQVMDASAARRERFRAQLALASFCLDMNRLSLAASLLEGLEQTIDAFRLEEWEPALAGRAFADLYTCLQKLKPKPTPDDAQRQAQIFARLCRLDPVTALKLDTGAAKGAR